MPEGNTAQVVCLSRACNPPLMFAPAAVMRVSPVFCDRQLYTDGKGRYLHAFIGTCSQCGAHSVITLER